MHPRSFGFWIDRSSIMLVLKQTSQAIFKTPDQTSDCSVTTCARRDNHVILFRFFIILISTIGLNRTIGKITATGSVAKCVWYGSREATLVNQSGVYIHNSVTKTRSEKNIDLNNTSKNLLHLQREYVEVLA
jgi:hypothetical protein